MTMPALPDSLPATRQGFLPEPKWLYRRLMIFAVVLFVGAVVTFAAVTLAAAGANTALLTLTLALIIQATILQVLYLVAPSAEYLQGIAKVVDAAVDGKLSPEPQTPGNSP